LKIPKASPEAVSQRTDNTIANDLVWLVGLWSLSISTIFQFYRGVSFIVEEMGLPLENHRPVASHWQTLSHDVVLSTSRHERGSNSQFSGDRRWLYR